MRRYRPQERSNGSWGRPPARRALRLSPRDPFSAIYYGIAAYAQFVGRNYDEAMRLAREGIRQRGDFVGALRVLTAAPWPDQTISPKPHCGSFAACNRIFRLPGSQAKCRSNMTSIGNTICKHSAARTWSRLLGLGC